MDNNYSNQASSFLRDLNRALDDLKNNQVYYLGVDINSPTIKSLLELQNRVPINFSPQDSIFSNLSQLKYLIDNLSDYQYYGPQSFIKRQLISYQIYRVALLIQKEIQLCFDRENIENLIEVLQGSCDEEQKLRVLQQFEDRISNGFDLELQDLILKARLFPFLESILNNDSCPPTVRENAGSAIAALARFNKNVFVGNVLMGYTIHTLVSMGSSKSLQTLTNLVKLIRVHIVDEMELNGEIPRIVGLLNSEVRSMALDCLLEMAYFSRKRATEAMIECGLIEKLVFLQRTENGSEGECVEDELGREKLETSVNNPFCDCLVRFAVQVEVGEVMEKREKKEIKMEILRRARAASVSEAEAAIVVAEVLWGSHP